jgi:hypothetical protein
VPSLGDADMLYEFHRANGVDVAMEIAIANTDPRLRRPRPARLTT